MKKITFFTLLIVLIVSGRTIAQPTLTASTNNPAVGNVFLQHQVAYTNPGAAGANVTWNFSGITSTANMTTTYLLPSATPYASLYPSANLASTINSNGSTYYSYFNASATSYTINGMNFPSIGTSMPYSDPEKMLSYPFTYNSTYIDDFATTVSGYDRHGSIEVTADAYGTLILPYGTITNVLRVKAVETYSDYISGMPYTNYTSTNYYWYKPGIHYYIFQLSQLYANGSLYQQYGLFLDQSNVGIGENTINQIAFNCFPNPATDKIMIKIINSSVSDNNIITLIDVNGKELINQEINNQSDFTEIDIRELNAGIYFLKLINNNKVQVQKIIKN